MGKVLPSVYNSNYYYPYKDKVTGKTRGLQVSKKVYFKYYKPGILKDDDFEALLAGETVVLSYNDDKGNPITVTIHLEPYKTTKGVDTVIMIIDTDEPEKLSDIDIITKNAEKIVLSYYVPHGYRVFDYNQPQKIVDSLSLTKSWRTWANKNFVQRIPLGEDKFRVYTYYTIDVYASRRSTTNRITFYGRVVQGEEKAEMITEAQFQTAKQQVAEYEAEQTRKAKLLAEEYHREIDKVKAWEKDLKDKIAFGHDMPEFIDSIEYILFGDEKIPDIELKIADLIKAPHKGFEDYVFLDNFYRRPLYEKYLTLDKHSASEVAAYKAEVNRRMRIYVEYLKLKYVRDSIYEKVKDGQVEMITSGIEIDAALNLGRFQKVQSIMLKRKDNPEKAICYECFLDEYNKNTLRDNILMMLKIYHDFYDFPEKDRKAIAKFIAVHRLSDYYEQISKYDDVLEELIDNSTDPKLLKPILTSVAGTSRAEATRNKTRSFERKATLNKKYILFKPIEFLDGLRDCIKEFNVSSNVAILMDILLDSDESFIFQFFTFSDEADGSDFDGRRLQYLTKIYNFHHPEKKIGFTFTNKPDDEEDDEDVEE